MGIVQLNYSYIRIFIYFELIWGWIFEGLELYIIQLESRGLYDECHERWILNTEDLWYNFLQKTTTATCWIELNWIELNWIDSKKGHCHKGT